MSKIKELIENIQQSKPVDVSAIFEDVMKERIAGILPDVMSVMAESAFGPEDEDEDDYQEIDFEEMSDEDFIDILNQMSDEDFDDLIDEIGELDESQLMEISKARLGSYIKKATHDAKQREYSTNNAIHNRDIKTAIKQQNKSNSRMKGVNKAIDKLTKEEVEQDDICEAISATGAKHLLDKHKAHGDFFSLSHSTISALHDEAKKHKYRGSNNGASLGRNFHSHLKKKAASVNEEVEQIDEISVQTQMNYKAKASKQMFDTFKKSNKGEATSNDMKNFKKRGKGLASLVKRGHSV